MKEDRIDSSTSASDTTAAAQKDPSAAPSPLLRPRRELFEHGLLPISKLIFSDGTLTLASLKNKLLQRSIPSPDRVDAPIIADALQISPNIALLVLDTLSAILPSDSGSAGTADVHDLVLFLYIQSYKRLLPRAHKDSAAVADVWPSTSAFDGYLSALSPLQLVCSHSRRSLPSQVDEEAHQLSYLQKHMANILTLLAASIEGEGDESLVIPLERFEHLGFLFQFSKGIPLREAAPFFANSDPEMPAVPVPAAHVHDWVLQHIAVSLEHNAERVSTKENGPQIFSDLDVPMFDASVSQSRVQSSSSPTVTPMQNSPAHSRSQTFVEGISKASVVKQECDIKGHSVKVLNCHDSVIYILAPLRYATVYGCSDATIILGAIGKAVRVEHCERVQVITAAKRICIANCRECVFFLGVNQRPLIVGDNHRLQGLIDVTEEYVLDFAPLERRGYLLISTPKSMMGHPNWLFTLWIMIHIKVAPFNTYYSQLEEHIAQVGVDLTVNKWDEPLVLGMVDPHDSLSHPAGVSDVQAESATCLDADQFTIFLIPKCLGAESPQPTKYIPFRLPEIYSESQKRKHSILSDIQRALRDVQLDANRKRDLAKVLHVHFKDWLYASGNIRQLYCLQGD